MCTLVGRQEGRVEKEELAGWLLDGEVGHSALLLSSSDRRSVWGTLFCSI